MAVRAHTKKHPTFFFFLHLEKIVVAVIEHIHINPYATEYTIRRGFGFFTGKLHGVQKIR